MDRFHSIEVLLPQPPELPPIAIGDPILRNDTVNSWHLRKTETAFSGYCHNSSGIVVSGIGHLWADGDLITADDLMPNYWRRAIEAGSVKPQNEKNLPVRIIQEQCICSIGWGGNIYGHFLIELLPRLLLGRRYAPHASVLLRSDSPKWLVQNLQRVGVSKIEFFEPTKERVCLRDGIFPSLLYKASHGFHPATRDLLSDIPDLPDFVSDRREVIYISRKDVAPNPNVRYCQNEAELIAIAERFGCRVVAPETLSWIEQIALFRRARMVIGLYGSGMHTALLSDEGLSVGIVGLVNLAQSHIAALRRQPIGYLAKNVELSQGYRVDSAQFERLLESMLKANSHQHENI